MIKSLISMLLGILLLSGFSTLALAGELKGQLVINTGPFTCTGDTPRMQNWTNKTASTLYIKQAQIWFGMDLGGRSDFAGTLYRLSDSSIILGTGWDHYSDPHTLHQYLVKFSPDYFTLEPGDTLQLQYFCTPITPGVHGHEAVTIWYTMDEP